MNVESIGLVTNKQKVHGNSPQKLGKYIRLMKSPNSNLGFGSFWEFDIEILIYVFNQILKLSLG